MADIAHHRDINQTMKAKTLGTWISYMIGAGKGNQSPMMLPRRPHTREGCWVVTPGPQKIPLVLIVQLLQKTGNKQNMHQLSR